MGAVCVFSVADFVTFLNKAFASYSKIMSLIYHQNHEALMFQIKITALSGAGITFAHARN